MTFATTFRAMCHIPVVTSVVFNFECEFYAPGWNFGPSCFKMTSQTVCNTSNLREVVINIVWAVIQLQKLDCKFI